MHKMATEFLERELSVLRTFRGKLPYLTLPSLLQMRYEASLIRWTKGL